MVLPSIDSDSKQGIIEGLKTFTRGEVVYFLYRGYINKAKIKAIYEIDELNTKYLVVNSSMSRWMIDHELYHSVNELVNALKECIVT